MEENFLLDQINNPNNKNFLMVNDDDRNGFITGVALTYKELHTL